MNERFKTLWFEAAESKGGDSWEEQTAFMERFAELIVRECAKVILAKASEYPETDEWYDWTSGMDQAQAEICVHFGVGE